MPRTIAVPLEAAKVPPKSHYRMTVEVPVPFKLRRAYFLEASGEILIWEFRCYVETSKDGGKSHPVLPSFPEVPCAVISGVEIDEDWVREKCSFLLDVRNPTEREISFSGALVGLTENSRKS